MSGALLLGATGQLGRALYPLLATRFDVVTPGSAELSLTDPVRVREYVCELQPQIIVNAAAYTDVDGAESDHERAFLINSESPGVLADTARDVGARMIHVSTDYVFDGLGHQPYLTDSAANPLNMYGASKLAGERAVMSKNAQAVIMRTAWLHSGFGKNFVGTAVGLLASGQSMRVVDDQVGAPTHAVNLANSVMAVIEKSEVTGMLHCTDSGVATWFDVACCVLETLRSTCGESIKSTVHPVSSAEFSRRARRPQISVLDTYSTRAILGITPPHWREGVVASTLQWMEKRHDA